MPEMSDSVVAQREAVRYARSSLRWRSTVCHKLRNPDGKKGRPRLLRHLDRVGDLLERPVLDLIEAGRRQAGVGARREADRIGDTGCEVGDPLEARFDRR